MMTFIMAELDCDEKENYKFYNTRVVQGGLYFSTGHEQKK